MDRGTPTTGPSWGSLATAAADDARTLIAAAANDRADAAPRPFPDVSSSCRRRVGRHKLDARVTLGGTDDTPLLSAVVQRRLRAASPPVGDFRG